MFENGLFTNESQDIIKQYLRFNWSENHDDDEIDCINADDINDDDQDAHSSIDARGGGHFRNFLVGMCRWEAGTLNLYQSWFSWILLPYTRVNSPNPPILE